MRRTTCLIALVFLLAGCVSTAGLKPVRDLEVKREVLTVQSWPQQTVDWIHRDWNQPNVSLLNATVSCEPGKALLLFQCRRCLPFIQLPTNTGKHCQLKIGCSKSARTYGGTYLNPGESLVGVVCESGSMWLSCRPDDDADESPVCELSYRK